MSENGGTLMDVFAGDNDMRDKYLAHLSHTKKCNTGQSFDNCFHNGTNGSMKYLNGSPVTNWGNNAGAILNNGALLRIWSNITCSNIQDNITRCGVIFIDVNGWKAPNTVGKDIYYFHVTKTGLKPYGAQGDGHANTCVSTSNGFGCAGALFNGELVYFGGLKPSARLSLRGLNLFK
ncbi:MAG: hypothetical protein MZV70_76885 [Desulfobacterales bacterium]|nr:hypothetical protein [Desulfobacterales bacterium]